MTLLLGIRRIRSGSNFRAARPSPIRETDLLLTWEIYRMFRTLRRMGAVAAFCLIASTTVGTASAAPQADPIQTFRNRANDGCLDYNRADGVRSYPCNGGPWQQWRVHVWADNTRQLQNVATGDCLSYNILGGDTIVGGACDASTLASWYVLRYSNGIAFQNQYDGDCLSTSSGYMHLSGCTVNDPAQAWF
ncbi:RICIN domain-containing protein [Streptomyces sp. NPDC088747]|uniref:RICIN domain-containing protein n=1 Tax=Streptomyces sp. NPDC088747 TaxID=3365886 RepID=UPI0037F345DF